MSRLIQFIPNEYYHIYNRGVNKMTIYIDNNDYERFQKLLYIINSKETNKFSNIIKTQNLIWQTEKGESLVDIGAYCLMPNHFHLLIKSKDKNCTALFLQRLQMSYSKYFNNKYDRSGSLFQGKSKAEQVVGDNYLKYLFSYIHLNPVKIIQGDWKKNGIKNIDEVKKYLNTYKYSSYHDFINEDRNELKILGLSNFPNYFYKKEDYINEIIEWLSYNKNEILKQK